jgi:hypothetical protein
MGVCVWKCVCVMQADEGGFCRDYRGGSVCVCLCVCVRAGGEGWLCVCV